MKNRPIIAAALSIAALVPAAAQAEEIGMRALSVSGRGVHVAYDDGSTSFDKSVTAGMFTWRALGASSLYEQNDEFNSFCVELTQSVSLNQDKLYTLADVTEVPSPNADLGGMGAGQAAAMSSLVRDYWDDATSGDRTMAAAFQLAAWEIVYEGGEADYGDQGDAITGLGLSSGWFTAWGHAAAASLADTWLASLVNNGIWAGVVGFTSTSSQDQISMSVVPLPAPVALAGLGLLGVVAGRRRLMARA